ncbi:L-fucose isomerase [Acidaminobacter sp. JC074]|uniref:L-fucose isomerase n=1 Tax=Acidaminobacter sp. JC074 TaxID=2530199 RepID=UPI001F0F7688|nr:L-fucose isomerase [Acidaminobacter sp. JC074]MCH4887684.1 L-fucose isomerase [Acidaminobacter sp. JC074]
MSFRLQGSLPKVGIRPTIDGRRRGVRESLEEQTMKMAVNVAHFIEGALRHASGEKVTCVIADSCIGGIAEAARCEEKFSREGVGLTLTVTPCWCYGTETMDMHGFRPKAIWGFNGTERPGAVYLAAAAAGHDQLGLPVFSIYGRDVQDMGDETIPEDVKEKILLFVKAGIAIATMKDRAYLSIGSVSMGIAGSIVDTNFFGDYLGMRNEFVDMSEISRRIEEGIYDQEEFVHGLKWVKENCQEGHDYNKLENQPTREKKDEDWAFLVKMTLIFRDLMIGNEKLRGLGFGEEAEGHNAIASGFQGQRHWTDYRPNGDFPETILNSSFDWNGIRESFVVATENDSLNAVPMLFGHLLTGRAQIFSDVRTYWSKESVKRVTGYELTGRAAGGIIHLINSGSTTLDGTGQSSDDKGYPTMKKYWDMTNDDVKNCLDHTRFCPANKEYFRGGGFSTKFTTRSDMKITMSRINIIKGLGPVLQIAEGYTVELPDDVHETLDLRTDPAWPTTWFAPKLTGKGAFKDVYSVMNTWGANHGAISFGHIGDQLITLASMLRIPVSMHNVEEERIFRPKAWSSYGSQDTEGADFRACQTYGPLYKK